MAQIGLVSAVRKVRKQQRHVTDLDRFTKVVANAGIGNLSRVLTLPRPLRVEGETAGRERRGPLQIEVEFVGWSRSRRGQSPGSHDLDRDLRIAAAITCIIGSVIVPVVAIVSIVVTAILVTKRENEL